jgi:hypothetical protein
MRRSLIFVRAAIVCAAVVGVIASTGEVAFAGSVNHGSAGVPGTPNCVGQTVAFVAQGNFNSPAGPGIGNVASQAGISAAQVQADIQFYCATGIVP